MNTASLLYYEFGPFRLSVNDRLLMRGEQVVHLTPKLIDMLIVLVDNAGHVVTKDVLMSTLWPDTFVEESSLTQNVSLLRRVLAGNGDLKNCIETIPKRGYRFTADVREITSSNHNPLPSPAIVNATRQSGHVRKYVFAIFLALLSTLALYWFVLRKPDDLVMPNSIAVLPFKTIGSAPENDVIGLGIADAVILRLTQLNRTTVLPTSSVFKYTQNDRNPLAIGRDLGVDVVLDGTVQRDGDRVRVSAVLIRLRDGKTVWSEKFDDRYSDVFALQDAISSKLAKTLVPQIEHHPPVHLTESSEAYEAYLMGLYFWNRRTRENLPKAITYLEDAVRKDPNFAKAHALLGDAYFLSSQSPYLALPESEASPKASASVLRALQLDDTLAEAHMTHAGIVFMDGKYDDADKEFRRAIDLNPNYAATHLRYGYFLLIRSELDQALAAMKRAVELDPVSPTSRAALAYVQFMARDFDGAMAEVKKAIELQPDNVVARVNLAALYTHKRMFDEAEVELKKLDQENPFVLRELAYLYAMAGRIDEARLLIEEIKKSKNVNELGTYDFAVMYAAVGDKDSAFEYLRKASPSHSLMSMLRFDPQLDSARTDPRFAELINRPVARR